MHFKCSGTNLEKAIDKAKHTKLELFVTAGDCYDEMLTEAYAERVFCKGGDSWFTVVGADNMVIYR